MSNHQQSDLLTAPDDTRREAASDRIQRQIEAADRAIDELVYELYGLTDEEIAIVEGDG